MAPAPRPPRPSCAGAPAGAPPRPWAAGRLDCTISNERHISTPIDIRILMAPSSVACLPEFLVPFVFGRFYRGHESGRRTAVVIEQRFFEVELLPQELQKLTSITVEHGFAFGVREDRRAQR